MNRRLVWPAVAAVCAAVWLATVWLAPACRTGNGGAALGTTYREIERPAVWRVVPRTQAESLGLAPGDVVIAYGDEPVASTAELVQRQIEAVASPDPVPMSVLRGDEELEFKVRPGVLGIMPEAERYSGSLAVAMKDVLGYFGESSDYDWLAALSGEAFSFAAERGGCRGVWVSGLAGEYLEGFERFYGLSFRLAYAKEAEGDTGQGTQESETVKALNMVRDRLSRGRPVLVLGEWGQGCALESWGLATRYEAADSTAYGYALGSGDEVALPGAVFEVYDVGYRGHDEPEPGELLTQVLTQALELGQAYADSGWQTGIAAYDVLIGALDSVPFCPRCPDSGRTDFEGLVWSLLARKESAVRFFENVREALPEQVDLIDEVVALHRTIVGKLSGVIQSGVMPGTRERQEKLARAINDIQVIESDLLVLYEELIGDL
jgi:hypothetical protein